ncbi:MAG TPA: 4-(cytidine 5'-diphospho)-2-C-methyl-D-erythritol kinase [Chloroflexota bacterium]|nr:4-(cytidine 5'-diphospho)-2-C-methyl-D-erythritol kinase [Chloroflexota bacterium]
MLTVKAFAKLNLSLEVIGRRSDGYHSLVSLMQTVGLHDTLAVSEAGALRVRCDAAGLSGRSNLAWRAALAVGNELGVPARCSIELTKRIPTAAGLGGGSSDAAATLVALQRLWGRQTSCDRLARIAASVGSDVPYFLYGGLCLVEGRGERITPVATPVECWYVLANPGIAVSTARVFAELGPDEWTDGGITRDLAARAARDPLQPGINGLQAALFRLYPAARECFELVRRVAPDQVAISGSGPTVFAVFETFDDAERMRRKLAPQVPWTAVTPAVIPTREEAPCRAA